MTNNEKMNEQIKDIAEAFKTMFTKEELEKLEKDFNDFQKRMLEQQSGSNGDK